MIWQILLYQLTRFRLGEHVEMRWHSEKWLDLENNINAEIPEMRGKEVIKKIGRVIKKIGRVIKKGGVMGREE